MRNLVTIQKIKEINPIKDADRIEVAKILGWNCVVKKGEFREGDLCVYFEIDSFLPEIEMFEFLRASSFKKTEWQGNGFRIKTQKLRKHISQGLLLPLNAIDEIGDRFAKRSEFTLEEGCDVTELFGVTKYAPPETNAGVGTVKGTTPYGIYKTDETRIQSVPGVLKELNGKPYYITSKMDGTSVTMYVMNGKFGITGRSKEFVLNDDCLYYRYAKKHGIEEKLLDLHKNVAIQGEFCGPKIQSNRCGLPDYEWFVFQVQDLNTMKFLDFDDFCDFCNTLGLTKVPIEKIGSSFDASEWTEEYMQAAADGIYLSGKRKEGIVIRPQKEMYSDILGGRLSFKILNNQYLLKNDL